MLGEPDEFFNTIGHKQTFASGMTRLLNGLVQSRARFAGDLERLELLRARIDEEIAAARKRLEAADTLIL